MERLEFDLLFRWFVGLTADEPAWEQLALLSYTVVWRARKTGRPSG